MTLVDNHAVTHGHPPRNRVILEAETTVPTSHGSFVFRSYREESNGNEHVAIISGTPGSQALVRVHSECATGEIFGSLKCECGPQLDSALDLIALHGGVVIYMRGHEGRGIGLANKLRAYRLQEDGVDTVDANRQLGLPDDSRDYTAAAEILKDLGIDAVRLLTNNPEKIKQLGELGINIADRVPLIVGENPENSGYLEVKRARMGHLLQA